MSQLTKAQKKDRAITNLRERLPVGSTVHGFWFRGANQDYKRRTVVLFVQEKDWLENISLQAATATGDLRNRRVGAVSTTCTSTEYVRYLAQILHGKSDALKLRDIR